MVSIKDVVRSSVKVPEFDKHLKKAGGHIDRNVVEITIKMKTIVRKTLMIKNVSGCFFSVYNRDKIDPFFSRTFFDEEIASFPIINFKCITKVNTDIVFTFLISFLLNLYSILMFLDPIYSHHHHVVPLERISLTLSRHFSLSFIASGRYSGLHPVSSHSCCMYVRAGRPTFARPYVGVHRSTSLMSSSLLLQLCSACLVRLTWIVFVMGGRWPYSWYLVGCCRQDLFNIALNILV